MARRLTGSRAESLSTDCLEHGWPFRLYADDVGRAIPARVDRTSDCARRRVNEIKRSKVRDRRSWTFVDAERVAFRTLDLYLRACLAKIDVGVRRLPVYLGQVGLATRHLTINSAVDYPATPFVSRITTENVTCETALKHSPRKIEFVQRLDVRRWTLPADDAPKYRDITSELDRGDIVLPANVRMGKFVKPGGGIAGKAMGALQTMFWLWLALVLISAVIGGLANQ